MAELVKSSVAVHVGIRGAGSCPSGNGVVVHLLEPRAKQTVDHGWTEVAPREASDIEFFTLLMLNRFHGKKQTFVFEVYNANADGDIAVDSLGPEHMIGSITLQYKELARGVPDALGYFQPLYKRLITSDGVTTDTSIVLTGLRTTSSEHGIGEIQVECAVSRVPARISGGEPNPYVLWVRGVSQDMEPCWMSPPIRGTRSGSLPTTVIPLACLIDPHKAMLLPAHVPAGHGLSAAAGLGGKMRLEIYDWSDDDISSATSNGCLGVVLLSWTQLVEACSKGSALKLPCASGAVITITAVQHVQDGRTVPTQPSKPALQSMGSTGSLLPLESPHNAVSAGGGRFTTQAQAGPTHVAGSPAPLTGAPAPAPASYPTNGLGAKEFSREKDNKADKDQNGRAVVLGGTSQLKSPGKVQGPGNLPASVERQAAAPSAPVISPVPTGRGAVTPPKPDSARESSNNFSPTREGEGELALALLSRLGVDTTELAGLPPKQVVSMASFALKHAVGAGRAGGGGPIDMSDLLAGPRPNALAHVHTLVGDHASSSPVASQLLELLGRRGVSGDGVAGDDRHHLFDWSGLPVGVGPSLPSLHLGEALAPPHGHVRNPSLIGLQAAVQATEAVALEAKVEMPEMPPSLPDPLVYPAAADYLGVTGPIGEGGRGAGEKLGEFTARMKSAIALQASAHESGDLAAETAASVLVQSATRDVFDALYGVSVVRREVGQRKEGAEEGEARIARAERELLVSRILAQAEVTLDKARALQGKAAVRALAERKADEASRLKAEYDREEAITALTHVEMLSPLLHEQVPSPPPFTPRTGLVGGLGLTLHGPGAQAGGMQDTMAQLRRVGVLPPSKGIQPATEDKGTETVRLPPTKSLSEEWEDGASALTSVAGGGMVKGENSSMQRVNARDATPTTNLTDYLLASVADTESLASSDLRASLSLATVPVNVYHSAGRSPGKASAALSDMLTGMHMTAALAVAGGVVEGEYHASQVMHAILRSDAEHAGNDPRGADLPMTWDEVGKSMGVINVGLDSGRAPHPPGHLRALWSGGISPSLVSWAGVSIGPHMVHQLLAAHSVTLSHLRSDLYHLRTVLACETRESDLLAPDGGRAAEYSNALAGLQMEVLHKATEAAATALFDMRSRSSTAMDGMVGTPSALAEQAAADSSYLAAATSSVCDTVEWLSKELEDNRATVEVLAAAVQNRHLALASEEAGETEARMDLRHAVVMRDAEIARLHGEVLDLARAVAAFEGVEFDDGSVGQEERGVEGAGGASAAQSYVSHGEPPNGAPLARSLGNGGYRRPATVADLLAGTAGGEEEGVEERERAVPDPADASVDAELDVPTAVSSVYKPRGAVHRGKDLRLITAISAASIEASNMVADLYAPQFTAVEEEVQAQIQKVREEGGARHMAQVAGGEVAGAARDIRGIMLADRSSMMGPAESIAHADAALTSLTFTLAGEEDARRTYTALQQGTATALASQERIRADMSRLDTACASILEAVGGARVLAQLKHSVRRLSVWMPRRTSTPTPSQASTMGVLGWGSPLHSTGPGGGIAMLGPMNDYARPGSAEARLAQEMAALGVGLGLESFGPTPSEWVYFLRTAIALSPYSEPFAAALARAVEGLRRRAQAASEAVGMGQARSVVGRGKSRPSSVPTPQPRPGTDLQPLSPLVVHTPRAFQVYKSLGSVENMAIGSLGKLPSNGGQGQGRRAHAQPGSPLDAREVSVPRARSLLAAMGGYVA